jgi:hypothetical protein
MLRILRRLEPSFFGLGLAASVTVTFPLVFHLGSRLPGCELVGPYSHVWKLWWTHQALVEQHASPAWSTLVNHPVGLEVGYYMASFGNGIWTLPATHLFGPVVSYNLVCLLTPAAGCWAAALLARELGLGRGPAALVGLSWALAPHYLGFMMGGGIENLGTFGVPLMFLAMFRLLGFTTRGPSERRWSHDLLDAGLLAGSLFVVALISWFNGATLALFSPWVLVVALVFRRKRALRGAAVCVAGLGAGAAAVALAARVLLPTPPDLVPARFFHVLSDNVEFLRMGWKQDLPVEILYGSTSLWLNHHLLLVLAALALVGAARTRGRLALLLTVPLLIDFLVPDAWSSHVDVPIPDALVGAAALPTRLFAEPQRRLFPLHLMVSLSAGVGLAWLVELARRSGRAELARWLPAVALGAWALELTFGGPVRIPLPLFETASSAHTATLVEGESGAVLDVPIMVDPLLGGEIDIKAVHSRFLFHQVSHGHPVMASVGTQLSCPIHRVPASDSLVALVINRSSWPSAWVPLPLQWRPDSLARRGYRWVVVHTDQLTPTTAAQLVPELRLFLGEPVSRAGDVLVFRVPDGGRQLTGNARPPLPDLDERRLLDVAHGVEGLKPHEYGSGCALTLVLLRFTGRDDLAGAWEVDSISAAARATLAPGTAARARLETFDEELHLSLRYRRKLMGKKDFRVTAVLATQALYRIWQLLGEEERASALEQPLLAQLAWAGQPMGLSELPLVPAGFYLPPCFWPVQQGPDSRCGAPGRPAREGPPCWAEGDLRWLDGTYTTSFWR